MKKSLFTVLLLLFSAHSLLAQSNLEDFAEAEAKRYKIGGIVTAVSGAAMIGGGAAMIYNDSKYASAMGFALLSTGVALDVGAVFMFLKGKQILEDARANEPVPLSFYVSPQGAQFVYRF